VLILVQASAAGDILIAGDNGGHLLFWDFKNRKLIAEQAAHRGDLRWAALSADGKFAVSSGQRDGQIIVWDALTGQKRHSWSVANSSITAGAISRDSRWLGMTYANGDIEIRKLPDCDLVTRISAGISEARSVQFVPDGTRFLVGGQNGELHVFSTHDWREIVTLYAGRMDSPIGGESTISGLATDAQGTILAAGMNYGRIRIWK